MTIINEINPEFEEKEKALILDEKQIASFSPLELKDNINKMFELFFRRGSELKEGYSLKIPQNVKEALIRLETRYGKWSAFFNHNLRNRIKSETRRKTEDNIKNGTSLALVFLIWTKNTRLLQLNLTTLNLSLPDYLQIIEEKNGAVKALDEREGL